MNDAIYFEVVTMGGEFTFPTLELAQAFQATRGGTIYRCTRVA